MYTPHEQFIPETVDEQIDQLIEQHNGQQQSDAKFIHDLSSIYEQAYLSADVVNQSLDHIWSRLAPHLVEHSGITYSASHVTQSNDTDRPQLVLLDGNVPTGADRETENMRPLNQENRFWSDGAMGDIPRVQPVPARVRRSGALRRTLVVSAAVAVVLLNILGWVLLTHRVPAPSTGAKGRISATATQAPATPIPSTKEQAERLLKQFQQEVTNWGHSHQYQDTYDGKTYELDYEYGSQGVGKLAEQSVQNARTPADYKAAIALIEHDMTNLQAMEADYSDKTPWNEVHTTDLHLLHNYNLTSGRVIVVSLIEQTLRVYQNGQLVKAFQITSGQYVIPSLPGLWSMDYRVSPVTFKSAYPKGSAYWYPDTQVNYAMQYHVGGYFIHDSTWRGIYGPGTNFPHQDKGSNSTFANNGAEGGINMALQAAAWLYNHTANGDAVLLY
jgi:lipoprotein-anchoring transpeptidase ErfK/SrfK